MPKRLRALVEVGFTVTLFSYHPPHDPIPGVTSVPLKPLVAGRVTWLDFWRNGAFIRAEVAARQIDVLMASYATSYGWLAVRSGVRPFLLETWTLDISHYPIMGWLRWMFGPIVRRVLQAADAITTDGSALAVYLREHYPATRSKVVPMWWGIRLADYEADEDAGFAFRNQCHIPADVPLVVSPRGLQHWYRPEVVLPALWALLEQHTTAHVLVLTVLHERTSTVDEWLNRLSEHPRGHVVDRFLTISEMQAMWNAADVVISIPTDDGISEALLEAMYAGALPVVSDIASNRSFLDEKSAFFVQGHHPEELTALLFNIVTDLRVHQNERVTSNQAWVAQEASVEGTAQKMHMLIQGLHEGQN